MKLIKLGLLTLGLVQMSFAQQVTGVSNEGTQIMNSLELMGKGNNLQVGGGTYIVNPPRKIFGSYYLFKDFSNNGIVYSNVAKKEYRIHNINVNLKLARFESEVAKDSVFAFGLKAIGYALIDDRKFKRMYVDLFKEERICEILVEDDNYTIYKAIVSDVRYNDPDPQMTKPNGDQYIIKYYYYIKRGENIEKFKLNKKSILGLFSDKKSEVENFVKENKLSWKKTQHFKQIYLKWKTL